MSQTLSEAAYQLVMWDLKRSEVVSALMEEFGVTNDAAHAAVTQAQNTMLGK